MPANSKISQCDFLFLDIYYIGCYIDNSDRMFNTVNVNDNMTVEMCVQLCMGNRYLGLQVLIEQSSKQTNKQTNKTEQNRRQKNLFVL